MSLPINFVASSGNNSIITINQNDYTGQPPAWHKDQTKLVVYRELGAAAAANNGGSMNLDGLTTSYLSYLNNNANTDFQFGPSDFTIEWWQYQTGSQTDPVIFSMGTQPTADYQFYYSGGNVYFVINGTANSFGATPTLANGWHYVAITSTTKTYRVFFDGVAQATTITNNYNFNNKTSPFTMGSPSTPATNSMFGGLITNFRVTKGVSLYTSNFTVPTAPLTAGANTVLLLLASSSATLTTDSSTAQAAKTPQNVTTITYSSSAPF